MEKKEYIDNVKHFFEIEGIVNLSQITDKDNHCESYFSYSNCECCNSNLGGDRYFCNGYNPTTEEVYEYSICKVCVYYSEYGEIIE